MTVTTSVNKIIATGDAIQVDFPYDFIVLEEGHMNVYLDGVLEDTANWSIAGLGDQVGGIVTMTSAPGDGVKVTLLRIVPNTQLTDYSAYGSFPAEAHERALDLRVMEAQQMDEEVGRSIRFSVDTDPAFDARFPSPIPGRAWKVSDDGLGVVHTTYDPDLPNQATVTAINVDSIAALRSISVSDAIPGVSLVAGYYTPGDGGGGPPRVLKLGAAGTYTDNGGSVIVPTGGDGSAAWVWEYSGTINVRWFGAKGDGATDDTTSIQGAVDAGRTILFVPGDTYLITSSITCGIFGQTLTAGGSLYSTSTIKYTGSGTAFVFDTNTAYPAIKDGVRVQGVPTTSTDYYNTGSVGIDITAGSVAITLENSWIMGFETLVQSNYNSFYNKFINNRLEQTKTILADFSNNNLIFEGNRCVRFNTAIETNGSDGPTSIVGNTFETFNGQLHAALGDEKGLINFTGNYIEDNYTVDLPTNFPAVGGAQFPTKFGQSVALFSGNYGVLNISGNDMQIASVFRVISANLVTKLVMKDNKIALAQAGNNLERLASFVTTDLKHLEIADTLRYTATVDAGFVRTYDQELVKLPTISSKDFHYFYDCIRDSYYENPTNLAALTPQNSWTEVVGYDLKAKKLKDGSVMLVGIITGGAAATVCATLPADFRPSDAEVAESYANIPASGSYGSGLNTRIRYFYATGEIRVEAGELTNVSLDGLIIPNKGLER